MGQKTPPVALRLCLNRSFDSSWFHENYSLLLHQDQSLRNQIHSILKSCGLVSGRVSVQFFPKKTLIHACLHDTGRGVQGSGQGVSIAKNQDSEREQKLTLALLAWSRHSKFPLELISPTSQTLNESFRTPKLGLDAMKFTSVKDSSKDNVYPESEQRISAMQTTDLKTRTLPRNLLTPSSVQSLNIRLSQLTGGQIQCLPLKIDSKYSSAHFLCGFLCQRLQEGVSFRSLVQQILQDIRHCPQIRGFRLQCSGRLGGVELARVESKTYGRTSLHVYSERIDYAAAPAWTSSGLLGVKVWISFHDDLSDQDQFD